jgi:hypothetical protein
MMGRSKTLITPLLYSFLNVAVPFTTHSKLCKLCRAKTIVLSQNGIFWLFFIQIYCAGSHTESSWTCYYLLRNSQMSVLRKNFRVQFGGVLVNVRLGFGLTTPHLTSNDISSPPTSRFVEVTHDW